jgi:hypothetical protein
VTQVGEAIKESRLDVKVGKCPFKRPPDPEDPAPEDEDYAWDDRVTMLTAQENDGGKLGRNVVNGSPGAGKTWNVLGADPNRWRHQEPQVDTARAKERGESTQEVIVGGKPFPYTVAAHHLIPGNASLYESRLFKCYMQRGGKVDLMTRDAGMVTFEVSHNIGYNVNGSHNGVWLGGSYAIVAGGKHRKGLPWEVLNSPAGDIAWCFEYMAVVAKKTGGQFHDSHATYNKNALKVLNKASIRLNDHQVKCRDCKRDKKVPPPYPIKAKLHNLSEYLRNRTQAAPASWAPSSEAVPPWMTSDQVRVDIFSDADRRREFKRIYSRADGPS